MRRLVAVGVLVVGLTACGDDDGNTPANNPAGEYRSDCDEHGNRVYLTEDDTNATPSIFVVPNDCEPR